MAITFENALGVLPSTLQYRSSRAEVLAGNIANVDTPGYQARDLDFKTVFDQQLGQGQVRLTMQQTNPRHITLPGNPELEAAVTEKESQQPSADGNSVDLGHEQGAFMRNRMEFETSFTFLNMKMKGLQQAIVG
ncbi:MAG: flagellar basal body rod protein FlgB [Endozoicomonas sp.]